MHKMPANEVLHSISACPEGDEKMAHSHSLLCFYIKKIPGNSSGSFLRKILSMEKKWEIVRLSELQAVFLAPGGQVQAGIAAAELVHLTVGIAQNGDAVHSR